jgi:hypothetical protein
MDDDFDPALAVLFSQGPPVPDARAFAAGVDRAITRDLWLRWTVIAALSLAGLGLALSAAGFFSNPEGTLAVAVAGFGDWATQTGRGLISAASAEGAVWGWLAAGAAAAALALVAGRLVEEA